MTPSQRIIIVIVACAFFMEGLDATIINTALPQIAHTLKTDPLHLKLALTAYLLTAGVIIPVSGWMADRFGCKRVFASAICLFLLGSILCGCAHTVLELVLSRILQGAGGALSLPVGRLLFLRNFSKTEFVAAMSTTATFGLMGPSFGPLIGGALTTYWTWRAIFFVNIPIGLIGIFFTIKYIQNLKDPTIHHFDIKGFLLLGGSLILLLMGLDTLIEPIFNELFTLSALLLGVSGNTAYYFYAKRRGARALINIHLFDNPDFRMVLFGSIFVRFGILATPFLVPLLLQVGFGYSPMMSGAMTAFAAFGMIFTKFFVSKSLARYGFRKVLIYNSFFLIASTLMLSTLSFHPPLPVMMAILFVNGALVSIQFSTMNGLSYTTLPRHLSSAGSSFISSMQQVMSSFCIAMTALILECYMHSHTILGVNSPPSFRYTFITIAFFPLIGILFFRKLPQPLE